METFDEWWTRIGRTLDPDTEDVPWYDKRKGLAEAAFNAAKAQSRNYTADEEVMPEKVTFGNGRVVWIAENKTPGVHNGVYLEVAQIPD